MKVNGHEVEPGTRWVPRHPHPDTPPLTVESVGTVGATVRHDGDTRSWTVSADYLSYFEPDNA